VIEGDHLLADINNILMNKIFTHDVKYWNSYDYSWFTLHNNKYLKNWKKTKITKRVTKMKKRKGQRKKKGKKEKQVW